MKCRECPLSLRCLAGRLGHICFCPDCKYITLEDVEEVTKDRRAYTIMRPMRLRCEKRGPELLKGTPPIMDGQGIIVPDPMGGFMGIAQCSKCEAKKRRAHDWDAPPESFYEDQELD